MRFRSIMLGHPPLEDCLGFVAASARPTELIIYSTIVFQPRHGQPMPEDNVWLSQRRAERAVLQ
jgi:hypothetical protein